MLVAILVPIIVLVCALVGFLWCRRRQRAKREVAKEPPRAQQQHQPGQLQHADQSHWLYARPDPAMRPALHPVAWASAPPGGVLLPVSYAVPLVYASQAVAVPAYALPAAQYAHMPFGAGSFSGPHGAPRLEGQPWGLDPELDVPPQYWEQPLEENA